MRGGRAGLAVRIAVLVVVLVGAAAGAHRLIREDGREGGPIVVGTTGSVASLDPAGAYDAASSALFSNLYQSLLIFRPGAADPVPDAAESCAFTGDDLLTYRCTLREDVTFADGRPMTARDVRFSLERITRIGADRGPAPLFEALREITADGRVVEFRLAAADATFPYKLAGGAASVVDSTAYSPDGLLTGAAVSGSGPYLLDGYERGGTVRLAPNPAYRGAQGRAHSPVTVRYFGDSEELAAAWEEGRIDVSAGRMPPAALAALDASATGYHLVEQAGSGIRTAVLDTRDGSPLGDAAVRQAVAALVDRQRLVREVHRGTVEALYSLIPQGMTGHGTPFFDNHPEPDRATAVALLAGAGVETPVRFRLAYARSAIGEAEAAELTAQLNGSGLFRVTTRAYEGDDFAAGHAAGDFDAYLLDRAPDYPDPDTFTAPLVGSGNVLHNGYRNEEIDALVRTTRRSQSRGRVMEDFRAIHREVAREVPVLPLWQQKDYVLGTPEVAGLQYLSDNSGVWRLWRLSWL